MSDIVTTVGTFLRHALKNRYSALKFCTNFSSQFTQNAMLYKLELADLVSSPPNELGNTQAFFNSKHKDRHGDDNWDIFTPCNELELADLVSSPPNELGNTQALINTQPKLSYSDNSWDIFTSCHSKFAIMISNLY